MAVGEEMRFKVSARETTYAVQAPGALPAAPAAEDFKVAAVEHAAVVVVADDASENLYFFRIYAVSMPFTIGEQE